MALKSYRLGVRKPPASAAKDKHRFRGDQNFTLNTGRSKIAASMDTTKKCSIHQLVPYIRERNAG